MEFEEFFKKKKINLDALQKAEPALFSEFKTHYQQMGEKSFDHTKKYWFNKIRRQFPALAEIKTEKVRIDNPLAEQTITQSLEEEASPPPKIGFTPKFRAANPPNPVPEQMEQKPAEQADIPPQAINDTPKTAYKPRFNIQNIPKKEE